MSGIVGGIIVLYILFEVVDLEFVFGVIQDGDLIICNVEQWLLYFDVLDEELVCCIEVWWEVIIGFESIVLWVIRYEIRGYWGLYLRFVN